jgi:cytoskeletal protein RodZ
MDKQALIEVGMELQKRRKAAKLTLTQVSTELKIRKAYIKGIENGDIHLIPFEAYILGYIKHYAILLGLDPKEYVDRVKSQDYKLASIASKNLITDKEFLPSKKLIAVSIATVLLVYIFLLIVG